MAVAHLKMTEQDLQTLSAKLASCCLQIQDNIIIYLRGELGAGKTTFARSFIQYYGVNKVKSPTYSIVESYQTPDKLIHHFDCYRLDNAQELEMIGIREYQGRKTICLFEWPEKAPGIIAPSHLDINFNSHVDSHSCRDIIIHSDNTTGDKILSC